MSTFKIYVLGSFVATIIIGMLPMIMPQHLDSSQQLTDLMPYNIV